MCHIHIRYGTVPYRYRTGTVVVRFTILLDIARDIKGASERCYGTVRYGTVRYGTGTGTVLSKRRQSSRLHHIKTSATCATPYIVFVSPLVPEIVGGFFGHYNACV